MPNLEKTLKGLECCKKLSAEDPFSGCNECPYNEVSVAVEDCRAVLCADALEILRPLVECNPVRAFAKRIEADAVNTLKNEIVLFFSKEEEGEE